MHEMILRLRAESILMMFQAYGKCNDNALELTFITLYVYIFRTTQRRTKILHVVSIYSLISDTREMIYHIASIEEFRVG